MNKNKVVLITGASSGMGIQAALFLASLDFIVYAGTREPDKLQDIKQKNLIPIKLDIRNASNITQIIDNIFKFIRLKI